MFSRLYRIPVYDRQADGRTDRQTDILPQQSALCIRVARWKRAGIDGCTWPAPVGV